MTELRRRGDVVDRLCAAPPASSCCRSPAPCARCAGPDSAGDQREHEGGDVGRAAPRKADTGAAVAVVVHEVAIAEILVFEADLGALRADAGAMLQDGGGGD